ncbi:unnamed protein product [Schistosoma curassoni]|uniref:Transmembrane protein n=1 Tax=Schistosoma curassoni TaxID=6186 RepID=A0A183JNN8_9TREM|nr:unnamed protein product [Schistosoma curassoni]
MISLKVIHIIQFNINKLIQLFVMYTVQNLFKKFNLINQEYFLKNQ